MIFWLILTLLFAILQAIAVARNIQNLEYTAKPAVMIFLFVWLYTGTGLQGNAFWFGLGIIFSLAGDVLLMSPRERFFLFGLIAFLLAHLSYIAGLREAATRFDLSSFILLALIALAVSQLLRRIVQAMRAKGEASLVLPVIVYGLVISVMLYAALATFFDPAWQQKAALFLGAGAMLFVASDAVLAWNKFVSALQNGRLLNIALYHLGQIGLIAGVILQFG